MNKRTKALAITPEVKKIVWERDEGRCVLCGSPHAAPNAHFISRAHGGLGIEQNIVTLCANCHHRYDQTTERSEIREILSDYLRNIYPLWDESKLIYRKYGGYYAE